MKLDYDLIRDILLTIEEKPLRSPFTNENAGTMPLLRNYDNEAINYTVKKLVEAGYLPVGFLRTTLDYHIIYSIYELTWEGHQALDAIRDDNVWNKTKDYIKENALSAPIQILVEIAKKILLYKLL